MESNVCCRTSHHITVIWNATSLSVYLKQSGLSDRIIAMGCHKTNIPFVLCALIMCLGFSSCKDTSTSIKNVDDIVFPDSNISYEKQVQPLFDVGCAQANCHERATDQNKNLNLTTYVGLKLNFGVVVPGDTSNSRLVWSIEGRPGSVPMPPSRPLNDNQMRGLKKWILEGANDTP